MRRRRAGFSLIEALVALAIASVTLLAIFELQLQMARGQQRAARAIAQSAQQENALALTRAVNPMAEPEGVIALPGGDTVRWIAEPHGDEVANTGFPMGQGAFRVQLYTMTVSVQPAAGPPPAPLVFDRMGWRRMSSDIPGLGF
ncbi:MAG TPA: prepilin-type N-terminal cleavage/methylation domain-containing protein [Brevundimonas sp.]|uniref:type IV pilus modification PilV family protein n=1 Tax=Brevundimonas sp. TaxID=1871086 RepID=UPI00261F3A21|nr:prepilin-type N-terminal cleavage/methylation domain-containing protein [Brevundimonas sp.]HRO32490.1 prepilin-type N-terminal cleavage/methylation domain-containing protein [Brevundimonas sp.]